VKACTESDIRLVDGGKDYQGHVEVCHDKIWGTVCDNGWSRSEGIVVCRQLGLRFVDVVTSSFFGRGTGGKIWLDDVLCLGSETRLIDCRHNEFNATLDCYRYNHAGVICEGKSRLKRVFQCVTFTINISTRDHSRLIKNADTSLSS